MSHLPKKLCPAMEQTRTHNGYVISNNHKHEGMHEIQAHTTSLTSHLSNIASRATRNLPAAPQKTQKTADMSALSSGKDRGQGGLQHSLCLWLCFLSFAQSTVPLTGSALYFPHPCSHLHWAPAKGLPHTSYLPKVHSNQSFSEPTMISSPKIPRYTGQGFPQVWVQDWVVACLLRKEEKLSDTHGTMQRSV